MHERRSTHGRTGGWRGLNRGGGEGGEVQRVTRETREKKDEELRLEKRVEGGDRSTHSLHSKLPQSVSPSVTGGGGDGSGTLVRRCARISNDFLEEEGEGRKGGSQTYGFHHHLLLQW